MSKVISKATIDKWNDDHRIEQLKHKREINVAVNPPKPKRTYGGGGRVKESRRSTIDPTTLMNRISTLNGFKSASPYNEYKDSIKKTTANVISSMGSNAEEQKTVRDKIMTSADIASICSRKLFDLNIVENEWAILGLTLAGKFLEAKWENRTP